MLNKHLLRQTIPMHVHFIHQRYGTKLLCLYVELVLSTRAITVNCNISTKQLCISYIEMFMHKSCIWLFSLNWTENKRPNNHTNLIVCSFLKVSRKPLFGSRCDRKYTSAGRLSRLYQLTHFRSWEVTTKCLPFLPGTLVQPVFNFKTHNLNLSCTSQAVFILIKHVQKNHSMF